MRFPQDRSFYIPKGSVKVASLAAPDAVVYIKDSEFGKNRFQAVGFRGKAKKATFNYVFSSEERRQKYVTQFFKNCEEINASKAKRRDDRKNAELPEVKEGDIYYASWGYDQTNIDFYQVVGTVGKCTILLRELGQDRNETSYMSGDTMPLANKFASGIIRKRIQAGNVIKFASYKYAYKWNGTAKRWSSYA